MFEKFYATELFTADCIIEAGADAADDLLASSAARFPRMGFSRVDALCQCDHDRSDFLVRELDDWGGRISLRYNDPARLDLEFVLTSQSGADALIRVIDDAPDVVATMLSLAPLRIPFSRSRANRVFANSPTQALRQHATSGTEQTYYAERLTVFEWKSEGEFDRVFLGCTRSLNAGQGQVAFCVMAGLARAIHAEQSRVGGGKAVLKQALSVIVADGARPGGRGVTGARALMPRPVGNEGFATEDRIWLSAKGSGDLQRAVIRCDATHVLLKIEYCGDQWNKFFPARKSRRAALTTAKRVAARYASSPLVWQTLDRAPMVTFLPIYPNHADADLFVRCCQDLV